MFQIDSAASVGRSVGRIVRAGRNATGGIVGPNSAILGALVDSETAKLGQLSLPVSNGDWGLSLGMSLGLGIELKNGNPHPQCHSQGGVACVVVRVPQAVMGGGEWE